MVNPLQERIYIIREQLARAAQKVELVAVSKTRTVPEMLEAEGFIDYFGENRVQEAMEKKGACAWKKPWRFIGSLQKNKIRKTVEIFDTIDSINSVELAHNLQRILDEKNKKMPVLIEVNTAEETKTGAGADDVLRIADAILEGKNLRLDGLMTIALHTKNETSVRKSFIMLRNIADGLRKKTGLALPVLSMGMSADFRFAVEEGSTLVRIGTALFRGES